MLQPSILHPGCDEATRGEGAAGEYLAYQGDIEVACDFVNRSQVFNRTHQPAVILRSSRTFTLV